MVEKNMKEEEESGLEERRAREQLGEGVEVGLGGFSQCANICITMAWCSGGPDLYGPENRQHLVSGLLSCILPPVKSYLAFYFLLNRILH